MYRERERYRSCLFVFIDSMSIRVCDLILGDVLAPILVEGELKAAHLRAPGRQREGLWIYIYIYIYIQTRIHMYTCVYI